jgi:hypothetical protein
MQLAGSQARFRLTTDAAGLIAWRKRVPIAELVRPFQPEDVAKIVALWDRCGLLRPWNYPRKDIARKQSVGGDLFLVAVSGGRLDARATHYIDPDMIELIHDFKELTDPITT